MTRCARFVTAATAAALLLLPASARAEWFLTPFAGTSTGGSTVDSRINFGAAAGWMGRGPVGFELDASWTPDFFDTGMAAADPLVSDSSVSTWMANIVLAPPAGDGPAADGMTWTPYVSAGLGAVRTRVESDLGLVDIKETNLGWNAGAGLMAMWERWGLRGDARYFRAMQEEVGDGLLTDEDDKAFSFWRLTAGLVFRFGAR